MTFTPAQASIPQPAQQGRTIPVLGANGLTAGQTVAALLDANGYGVKDILAYTGADKRSLTDWRQKDAYTDQVDTFRKTSLSFLDREINELRVALLAAAQKAVLTLVEGMDAETASGNPNWNARLTAATTVLMQSVQLIKVDKDSWKDDGKAQDTGPRQAVIVVNSDGSISAGDVLLGTGRDVG